MKRNIKIKIIILSFSLSILLSFALSVSNGTAVRNCLNSGDSENPKYPQDYHFFPDGFENANEDDTIVEKSSYSTHDWIADAVVRELQNYYKNRLMKNVWAWLMDSSVGRDSYPKWISSYSEPSGKHRVVRSYMTYLYATQMPDPYKGALKEIRIYDEGESIKNLPSAYRQPYAWVGNTALHGYHFTIKYQNDQYKWYPPPKAASSKIVLRLATVGAKKYMILKDKDGNSAMKPEVSAGYLGAMTHYFADLTSPAHLLEKNTKDPKTNELIYSSSYHSWYEDQLSALTYWDKNYEDRSGPYTGYFRHNEDWPKEGITSIRDPKFSLNALGNEVFNFAFARGRHQYDVANDDENTGLYIKDSNLHWNWKADLDAHNGIEGSDHENYYEKVQIILSKAVYHCACAFQWLFDVVKRQIGDIDLNPNNGQTEEGESWEDPYEEGDPWGMSEDSIGRKMNAWVEAVAALTMAGGVYFASTLLKREKKSFS